MRSHVGHMMTYVYICIQLYTYVQNIAKETLTCGVADLIKIGIVESGDT